MLAPRNAPEWANDPSKLWNAAEKAERINGLVAREFEFALPHELTNEQRAALVKDMCEDLVERYGFALQASTHEPHSEGADERNYHVHILATTRRMGPEGLTEKTRELDRYATGIDEIKWFRERVATLTNQHLEAAGIDARVDHRRLTVQAEEAGANGDYVKALALTRAPQIHEGKTATAMRRCGTASDRAAINDAEKQLYRIELQDFLKLTDQEAKQFMHTTEQKKEVTTPLPAQQQQQQAKPAVAAAFADRLQAKRDAPIKPQAQAAAPAQQQRAPRATNAKIGHVRLDRGPATGGKKDKNETAKLEALEEWVNSITKCIEHMISDSAKIHAQNLQRVVSFDCTDQNFRDPHIKQELQEILKTAQQFIKDDTRFSRREQSYQRLKISQHNTREELRDEQKNDSRPSAFRVQQNREWKKRREQRLEKFDVMKQEERRAKRQLSPEKQAAYLQKSNETGKQLTEQLAAFERRYPLALVQNIGAGPAPSTPQPNAPSMELEAEQQRKNRFRPGGH